MLPEPSARSLLQTKLKIQRKVGTCSGVINKFTQKVDTRACGLRVPRAIMAPQTGFGSPTFAPDLPEGLCCEPTGPSKVTSDLPTKEEAVLWLNNEMVFPSQGDGYSTEWKSESGDQGFGACSPRFSRRSQVNTESR